MSIPGCCTPTALFAAYWLFSQTKTMGSFHTDAMLSASWNSPSAAAPSPKKHTVTSPLPSSWAASAAPHAMGSPPPTMPLAPSMPTAKSAMCIDPPLPLQ